MIAGLFEHNDGVVAQKAKDITENVDATFLITFFIFPLEFGMM